MKSGMRFREMVIRTYNKTSFDILGLPNTASKQEIKLKYYELAQKHHPDKTGLKNSDFLEIKNAYENLKGQVNQEVNPAKQRRARRQASRHFEPSRIITSSMLIGVSAIAAGVIAMWISLSESRSKAINDAWEEHARQRSRDGLDGALGYERKKS
jgi:hypothetical protein